MEQKIATLQKIYGAIAEFIVNYSFQIPGAGLSIIGNSITAKGGSDVVDETRLAATILSTEDDEHITIPLLQRDVNLIEQSQQG